MGVPLFEIVPVNDDGDRSNDAVYRRADGTGDPFPLREAAPGAVWEGVWSDFWAVNGNGPALIIKLPNGHNFLPGQSASNCNLAGTDHDCWCVHGEVPNLTIDKEPEPGRPPTCTEGAGSIWAAKGSPVEWHGFVRNGVLLEVSET